MRTFSLDDLSRLKRNGFSKNLVDNVAKEHSTYLAAYNFVNSSNNLQKSKDIDFFLTKYLVTNPFAICHAIWEISDNSLQFLQELYEKQYGDFLFALKINHLRKILCVQIINSNVPKDFREVDATKNKTKFSYDALISYLENSNRKSTFMASASEIGDFGFIKCAMFLSHEYGIQDLLATLFRILQKKYDNQLETKLQEATFAIPIDNAKYGIVAMVTEFNSFKLNGMLLDVEDQKDSVDIIDSMEIYKKTQYMYRIGFSNVEFPSNDSIYRLSSTI